jgi:hypothetical protein
MARKNTTKSGLTVDELLARKNSLPNYSVFHSVMFDTDFELEKIKPADILTIMQTDGDEYEKYGQLIYTACPFFRQKELIDKLGVENPYDVPEALYGDNYAELWEFGNFILARYGFNRDRLDTVKK